MAACFAPGKPQPLIGDRAYDSDPLDERLAAHGIEMIAPYRRNRRVPVTKDGRKLRRWKLECFFAWLGNFRQLPVRL